MKQHLTIAAATLAGMLLASRIASAALVGVTSTEPSEVYSIDPATGAATLLTTLDVGGSLVGATFLAGVLYASDLYDESGLFVSTVDLASGVTTFFSDQDSSSNWHGLASNEGAGLIYAIDLNDGNILKSVNSAAVVTAIGVGNPDVDGRGMAYDDTNGVLYATGRPNGSLYVVDTSTGTANLIGDTGLPFENGEVGLAYDEDAGLLYANISSDGLYTIDVVTAAATFVGDNNFNGIDGLAWIADGLGSSERATFTVTKDFTDDNPNEVEVAISCNTGLPLDQSKAIDEGSHVEFVVVQYDVGELDCDVFETVPFGYSPSYQAGTAGGVADAVESDSGGCHFIEVEGGEFTCHIVNTPDPVDIEITKEWVFEGSSVPQGINTNYDLTLYCNAEILWGSTSCAVAFGEVPAGGWSELWCKQFSGDGPDVFEAQVIPEYPSSACWVVEHVYDDAVEVDNGCGDLVVSAGYGDSCTIVNTVYFEGIPTLNPYGLALLALTMLGVGLAGFRRIA